MSDSDRPPSLDPARLADQAGWVRDLARRLVRDATDAEDLAQDVLLAGLEHPPHALDDRHLRGWLAGVALKLTLFRARARGRRAERERTAARSAIAPGTDEVVGRAQEVRRLVDAVLALEEPNKSAVLLAHLEGLSSRAIAKRLGTTPQNARKRVSRGLAQVRAKLVREDRAGSGDWLSGLLLVAHLPTPMLTTAASPAAVLMSSKLLAASLVGALALFGLMTYLGSGSPADSPGLLPGASATSVVGEELLAVGSTDQGETGRRETSAPGAVPASEQAVPAVVMRRGSVREAHDRSPIAGAELREANADASYSDRVLAVTNSAGEFSIDDDGSLPEGFCVVHPGTFELHVERARIDSGAPLDLVVVGLGGVTVRASKEGGGPAAGEHISYSIDPIHGSDAQMWRWRHDVPAGATDADGVLQVDGLPVGTPLRFRFQNEWFGSLQTVIDPTLLRAEVELVRPVWSAVRMRLVDAAGAPVVGALVNWYGTLHRSGDGRSFQAGRDGVVTITDISAGHGSLVFPSLLHAPIELEVAPGETRDLGNIVLAPKQMVSGTLRSVTGADLSALRVTVFQARIAGGSVPVAADGAFRASAIDAPLTLVVTGSTLGRG
ncbi:MAG: sigma-70 family RNA polymerase sigma factor, partial [Planctomycetota bacterium]